MVKVWRPEFTNHAQAQILVAGKTPGFNLGHLGTV